LQSAGTTAVTIDTSQNVGIGTASPATKLEVVNSAGDVIRVSNGTQSLNLGMNNGSGGSYLFENGANALRFGTNGTERMRINAGAPILCLSGGSTSATGTGIAFPATQSASSDANTLDDYEEGTWTPTDNSGASLSFTGVSATYVKVGQMVIAWCQINYPSTASTNGASITGLPFTVAGQDIYGGFTRYSTYGYVYPTLGASGVSGSLYTTGGSQIQNTNLSTKRVDFTYVYRSNA
jgi:hypothetical protein